MFKNVNRLLCLLLIPALVLSLAGCGQADTDQPTITDTGAGDSNKQVAALTALNSLKGKTEKDRLAELNTKLPNCPFCGKPATWSAFQYDNEDPDKIARNNMSADETAPSHFYVYGDKTTVEGNWLSANVQDAQHYACILLDGNIASEGSILAFFPAIMNVGGRGTVTTTTSGQGGLFAFVGSKLKHELNLYGGTFYSASRKCTLESAVIYTKDPSSVVNIWSDDVVIGSDTNPADSLYLNYNVRCGGTLNMYGGTIRNGKASTGSSSEESANLHLLPGSHFNMYGGTIEGGYARKGGNIYIASADVDEDGKSVDNAPVANIFGGTIQNGYGTSNGGGIYNKSTALRIKDCKLLNNKTGITGGNLWTNKTTEITGTLISGGVSTNYHGGNIFLSAGNLTLDASTTVENGKAPLGRAGNIYVNPGCTLTANGPIVQNTDEIHADLGGNIYLAGRIVINGLISGGHSSGSGGNIYVVGEKGTVILGDGEVKDGISNADGVHGGNISFSAGILKLTGSGKISGGILMPDDDKITLEVEPTFTGDVTLFRDGTAGKPGTTVKFATCKGAFTGTVKNENRADTNDQSNGLPMEFNGKSGLKYSVK